jgi:uncharacterized SAM-binding protein YcdF (DUF218 family)
MNSVLANLGIVSWKPALTALALPPVPLIALLVVAAVLLWARRAVGWLLFAAGSAGLWLASCAAVGDALQSALLDVPPALSAAQLQALQRATQSRRDVVIVVLGGGRESQAPEYGAPSLTRESLERLRYGAWLARRTGAPLAFTGGVGHAQNDGQSEAEVAMRIAREEFGRPLSWIEKQSRDTRENATGTLAMLRQSDVVELVVVTHGWHMPRALRAFRHAAGVHLRVTPAPIALGPRVENPLLRWLPTSEGHAHVRHVLREALGRAIGH